jgi:hypothetical protein
VGDPAVMTAQDNSCIYLAHVPGHGTLSVYELDLGISRVVLGISIDSVQCGTTPTLLTLFAGGEPPDPQA